ncbi:sulfite exporter TauE/SafE family protein [Acetomicrobium hydrogeniformans]|uniref:Probable membrane transporter protein n=1 Tax=Acetomicrobium hydrogeniformans TaxID=649746 RepID=A0A7V6ZFS7_9BACT|nr:sulfite exporter TauE/SafE family protein [Acetomicrobium hydrogeniformans]HHZ05147.1 sulfite exporter TauE/SafE family protein [Acetomicrobium hydrogeniformans]
MFYILITVISFIAGSITGLIGASGVMVIVPGLVMLGSSTFDAIGCSLFADALASLVVAWTYSRYGNLNLRQGWPIALGSILGAQLGSFISPNLPEMGVGGSFGVLLLVSAAMFWRKGSKKAAIKPEGKTTSNNDEVKGFLKVLRNNPKTSGTILGVLVGIISGILGAGGGVMILLILVFVMGYKVHEGVGTSTLIMAFTAASGALGHAFTGNLPMDIAIPSAIGTVVGGRLTAGFANKINEAVLGRIVGIIFAVLGALMIFGVGQ